MCVKDTEDPNEECNCILTVRSALLDFDHDYVHNKCDNCWKTFNSNQTDTDGDGVGDVCDNCQSVRNRDQRDSDKDRIGDKCDTHYDISPYVQELNGDKKDVVSGIMEMLLEMYSSK